MKSLVLVKPGEYRPTPMNDLAHAINNSSTSCFPELLRFSTKSSYSFRLYRDSSSIESVDPLALVPYFYNPDSGDKSPSVYFPIDLDFIQAALESYEFVLVGSILEGSSIPEPDLLPSLKYLTRDSANHLIDIMTGEVVLAPPEGDAPSSKSVISMLGVVKLGALPIYYLVLDDGMVSTVDFIEYKDQTADRTILPIQSYDGNLASHLMNVVLSDNATRVGKNTLIVSGESATLNFFTEPWTQFVEPSSVTSLPSPTVTGTCGYSIEGPKLILKPTKPVSSIKICFDLGRFFTLVHPDERPCLEFVVYAV